jgi:hypothetical protein
MTLVSFSTQPASFMVQVRLTPLVFVLALVVLVLSTTIFRDIVEIINFNNDINASVIAFNRDPSVSSAMVSASKCREWPYHGLD